MPDFRIRVVADTGKAKADIRDVDRTLSRTEKTAGALGSALKRAFLPLTAALGARELILLGDQFTNIQNRLRTVTSGTEELTAVTQSLFDVANSTRSSFAATAEVYARIGSAAKELGRSQQELVQFTKSLNQAVILSGASAAEAQAGLIQLSQGLASGALRGDELRSVLEQLPAVADVIAKHLGITRGALRDMGAEGKITADIVLDAFKSAREELEERFGKSVPTVSQAFQVLQNNVVGAVGEFNKATGFSENFARALLSVADAIKKVTDNTKALELQTEANRQNKEAVQKVKDEVLGLSAAIQTTATQPIIQLPKGRETEEFFAAAREILAQQGPVPLEVEISRETFEQIQRLLEEIRFVKKAAAEPLFKDLPKKLPVTPGVLTEIGLDQAGRNLRETQDLAERTVGEVDLTPAADGMKKASEGALLLSAGIQSATDALINFVDTGRFGIYELTKTIRDAALRLLIQTGAKALGLPGFQHGGSFTVGGTGGPDSQTVAFRATPGERVTVAPPNVSVNPQVNLAIANVSNQREAFLALGRSPEGARMILNVLEENRNTVRQLVAT